ncbi:hypothetical protein HU200_028984 [Digitaria exilis]|uniref:Uncharacterized protein n=1 Tax=Digitaria exilis TaxID=1010633 RepID=A0A835EV80_9POAL|nr:hypothetical protein HU200_028984 [Digitaria exilis]
MKPPPRRCRRSLSSRSSSDSRPTTRQAFSAPRSSAGPGSASSTARPPCWFSSASSETAKNSRFVSNSSFRPRRADCSGWCAVDARHGRVLLHRWKGAWPIRDASFAIWDPITGEWVELPILLELNQFFTWAAAVLCTYGDACCHLACCHVHLQVVVVANTPSVPK